MPLDRRSQDHSDHVPTHGASNAKHLGGALGVITAFMAGEVVAAVAGGSLALFSDAGHMLTDAAALAMALWAARLAARPATGSWTYGLKRAEILSAAVNGGTLLVVAGLVSAEAVGRMLHPVAVKGALVAWVALAGMLVNVVAALMLRSADRDSLNVEGAFRHVLTDLYGFAATLVGALIIIGTGFRRADTLASMVVVVLMVHSAWVLLRASGRVLLEGVPKDVDIEAVRSHMLETLHVRDVHDLHVWSVTSDLPALSAHVVIEDSCFVDGHAPQILDGLQACLSGHFDVSHSTFQLEPASHLDHEDPVH